MVRKIKSKRILQLRAEGFSRLAIASTQGISRTSVAEVLDAVSRSWDEVNDVTEEKVYQLLVPVRSEHDHQGIHAVHLRAHGALVRCCVDHFLHAVQAIGLARQAGSCRDDRCDHGPHRPQHDLGGDR